jgi:putative integral membrane protein (TIGR02587 family)
LSRPREKARLEPAAQRRIPHTNRRFAVGLARAFGGALVFSLPLLMTMEMWWLGFHMDRLRLALLLATEFPLLVALAHFAGFEDTTGLVEALVDAAAAFAVACVTAAATLVLFGIVRAGMGLDEVVGKIAVQAVPGSIGALLAQSQFGRAEEEGRKRREAGRLGEYFFMAVGALFLAANVAPTEEMILIAHKMSHEAVLLLCAVSLACMHAFVFAVEFRGEATLPPGVPFWSAFARFTVLGYVVALGISAYVLWTFGRFDGTAPEQAMKETMVLGFPSAIGAAAARLIL